MFRTLKSFLADERGQASTEYAVIIGIVALALITVLIAFKEDLIDVFEKAETDLDAMTP